jgi:hypothetical protein
VRHCFLVVFVVVFSVRSFELTCGGRCLCARETSVCCVDESEAKKRFRVGSIIYDFLSMIFLYTTNLLSLSREYLSRWFSVSSLSTTYTRLLGKST